MEIDFPDISNFNEVSELLFIFFGILTVDVSVLFLARYYKVGGRFLNEWYDQFNVLAVLADVMIIFIGFLITRYIYTQFLFQKFEWNVVYFMLLLIVVQLIHDIFFYFCVIKPIPVGQNEMMDVFKSYANDLGAVILGGDAMLMIGSALVAMFYKYMPTHVFVSVSSIFVYALPYILFTRNPFNGEEVKVDKKKEDDKTKTNQESVNMKRFFNIQGET
jgi:hypothetical protein